MIEVPTVFILGAGASEPYEYPLGTELRTKIVDNLRQNRSKHKEIIDLDLGYSEKEIIEFADDLYKSNTYTIDDFLKCNDDKGDILKVAIAQVLIPKEIKKNLSQENNPKHWYRLLNRNLQTPSFEDFLDNQVKIITFNYDRSLEENLFISQQSLHRKTFNVEILMEFPILHIFGKLGDLDWEDPEGRAYDPTLCTGENLKSASEGIRTLHEDDGKVLLEAEKFLEWADEIYFLGFGYDINNLQRLNVFNYIERNVGINKELVTKTVAGTAYKFSYPQKSRIKDGLFKNKINLGDEDEDCVKFLNRYGF